jgi:pimeloyl-ACP methyl ester carboxylesterase
MHELVAADFPASPLAAFAFDSGPATTSRNRNPMNLPKTKYARSGDVRIAYQITGDGPFDVVWAPGTMSHLDLDWEIPQRLFFERFSKFCRLIRFDKRGTGLSDRHTPLRSGPNSFPHIGRSQILVARTFG